MGKHTIRWSLVFLIVALVVGVLYASHSEAVSAASYGAAGPPEAPRGLGEFGMQFLKDVGLFMGWLLFWGLVGQELAKKYLPSLKKGLEAGCGRLGLGGVIVSGGTAMWLYTGFVWYMNRKIAYLRTYGSENSMLVTYHEIYLLVVLAHVPAACAGIAALASAWAMAERKQEAQADPLSASHRAILPPVRPGRSAFSDQDVRQRAKSAADRIAASDDPQATLATYSPDSSLPANVQREIKEAVHERLKAMRIL